MKNQWNKKSKGSHNAPIELRKIRLIILHDQSAIIISITSLLDSASKKPLQRESTIRCARNLFVCCFYLFAPLLRQWFDEMVFGQRSGSQESAFLGHQRNCWIWTHSLSAWSRWQYSTVNQSITLTNLMLPSSWWSLFSLKAPLFIDQRANFCVDWITWRITDEDCVRSTSRFSRSIPSSESRKIKLPAMFIVEFAHRISASHMLEYQT